MKYGLADRLLDAIRDLDEEWRAYPLNRYQHSLQAAGRAFDADEDEEYVIAALIHDIGDTLAPFNHGELAAAIAKPYMSEKTHWILKHHCVFQGIIITSIWVATAKRATNTLIAPIMTPARISVMNTTKPHLIPIIQPSRLSFLSQCCAGFFQMPVGIWS